MIHDQIHSPGFQKLSDFIWSPDNNCSYIHSVIAEHNANLKIFNEGIRPGLKGVIFVGMCQAIEECYKHIPEDGSYIVIHRPSDRSYTYDMHKRKPRSVKHVYTVDCDVTEPDVTAIPFGLASINGDDNVLKQVYAEDVPKAKTQIFCRYNVNNSGYTKERIASLPQLQAKPFAKVITSQIPADDFFREIKAHRFTMSLQGHGKDCARTYSAMILGSIPIVTECREMRHFSDMPMVYCPPNIAEDITPEWLNRQAESVKGKSMERVRMSYWANQINKMRRLL